MKETTNVSLKADRKYVQALGVLGTKHEKTIGELVRAALDKEYGDEIATILHFFAANSVPCTGHSVPNTDRS